MTSNLSNGLVLLLGSAACKRRTGCALITPATLTLILASLSSSAVLAILTLADAAAWCFGVAYSKLTADPLNVPFLTAFATSLPIFSPHVAPPA
jgi:hypothetical protein